MARGPIALCGLVATIAVVFFFNGTNGRSAYHCHRLNPRLSRQRFVHSAIGWLTFLSRLEIPSTPVKPYDHMLGDFAEFLRKERGLAYHD